MQRGSRINEWVKVRSQRETVNKLPVHIWFLALAVSSGLILMTAVAWCVCFKMQASWMLEWQTHYNVWKNKPLSIKSWEVAGKIFLQASLRYWQAYRTIDLAPCEQHHGLQETCVHLNIGSWLEKQKLQFQHLNLFPDLSLSNSNSWAGCICVSTCQRKCSQVKIGLNRVEQHFKAWIEPIEEPSCKQYTAPLTGLDWQDLSDEIIPMSQQLTFQTLANKLSSCCRAQLSAAWWGWDWAPSAAQHSGGINPNRRIRATLRLGNCRHSNFHTHSWTSGPAGASSVIKQMNAVRQVLEKATHGHTGWLGHYSPQGAQNALTRPRVKIRTKFALRLWGNNLSSLFFFRASSTLHLTKLRSPSVVAPARWHCLKDRVNLKEWMWGCAETYVES